MASRRDELIADLEAVVAKHHEWLHDEAWVTACHDVGAGYFGKIARHYDTIQRFIDVMRLDEQEDAQ